LIGEAGEASQRCNQLTDALSQLLHAVKVNNSCHLEAATEKAASTLQEVR